LVGTVVRSIITAMNSPDFLNVDLCIESKSALRCLAREFGSKVIVLFSGRMKGRHCLYLEIAGADRSQDRTLNVFCSLVEALSERGKSMWAAAVKKEFDLGYEARLSLKLANRFTIRPNTLRRVTRLGATVAVTIYRERDAAMRVPQKTRENKGQGATAKARRRNSSTRR
jgi:hypothetical protein